LVTDLLTALDGVASHIGHVSILYGAGRGAAPRQRPPPDGGTRVAMLGRRRLCWCLYLFRDGRVDDSAIVLLR
jgi:hypothetical protein